jgi:hypothetical protein
MVNICKSGILVNTKEVVLGKANCTSPVVIQDTNGNVVTATSTGAVKVVSLTSSNWNDANIWWCIDGQSVINIATGKAWSVEGFCPKDEKFVVLMNKTSYYYQKFIYNSVNKRFTVMSSTQVPYFVQVISNSSTINNNIGKLSLTSISSLGGN